MDHSKLSEAVWRPEARAVFGVLARGQAREIDWTRDCGKRSTNVCAGGVGYTIGPRPRHKAAQNTQNLQKPGGRDCGGGLTVLPARPASLIEGDHRVHEGRMHLVVGPRPADTVELGRLRDAVQRLELIQRVIPGFEIA